VGYGITMSRVKGCIRILSWPAILCTIFFSEIIEEGNHTPLFT
jgi:hypothetical protein